MILLIEIWGDKKLSKAIGNFIYIFHAFFNKHEYMNHSCILVYEKKIKEKDWLYFYFYYWLLWSFNKKRIDYNKNMKTISCAEIDQTNKYK